MPVSPRDLGSVADATVNANDCNPFDFIRIDFPTIGIKRFTNYPGFGSVNQNIDGAAADWYHYDIKVGSLTETDADANNVDYIECGNLAAMNGFLDKQWSKWKPYFKGAVIYIYRGFYTSLGAWAGSYGPRFTGVLGGASLGDIARITVKPKEALTATCPWALISSSCVNVYRGADCGFVGSEPVGQVTCDKSRKACRDRSNELNFNGFDLMPAPGTKINWQG